jgi:hypothetical protein
MISISLRRLMLEAEADAAALEALAGGSPRCHLADGPERLSGWGEAGHYYTSLYIMLAALLPKKTALRRAFFCQMPDQVYEFDAKSAGIDLTQNNIPHKIAGIEPATAHYDLDIVYPNHQGGTVGDDMVYETEESVTRRHQNDLEIQEGLHCINGHKEEAETRYRRDMLELNYDDELRFGLALHAFGDSFAHRINGVMPSPPFGHMWESLFGTDPDNIYKHSTAYINYVGHLFEIVGFNNPTFVSSKLNDQKLMADAVVAAPSGRRIVRYSIYEQSIKDCLHSLSPLFEHKCLSDSKNRNTSTDDDASKQQEKWYCDYIRGLIVDKDLCSATDLKYHPEDSKDNAHWLKFQAKHSDDMIPLCDREKVRRTVRLCAHDWSLGAGIDAG